LPADLDKLADHARVWDGPDIGTGNLRLVAETYRRSIGVARIEMGYRL
jgi:hypothetical protein